VFLFFSYLNPEGHARQLKTGYLTHKTDSRKQLMRTPAGVQRQ